MPRPCLEIKAVANKVQMHAAVRTRGAAVRRWREMGRAGAVSAVDQFAFFLELVLVDFATREALLGNLKGPATGALVVMQAATPPAASPRDQNDKGRNEQNHDDGAEIMSEYHSQPAHHMRS